MVVTAAGMTMLLRLSQFSKALLPMLVSDAGKVIPVRGAAAKALLPIEVMFSPSTTSFSRGMLLQKLLGMAV